MNRLRKAGNYFRTLKYLRFAQVFWQVAYRIYRPRIPDLPDRLPLRQASGNWVDGMVKTAAIQEKRFCCLHEAHTLDSAVVWETTHASRLWRYNLHYFDFIHGDTGDRDADDSLRLMERWVAEHPAGTGWEPYPLSLRIVNWIRFHLEKKPLSKELLHSLVRQGQLLSRQLEYHIGANHLFSNGKALTFAGLFFEGAKAEQWLRKGTRILRKQIPEQFLEDGGHYERSPLYHSVLLEDLLDLRNLLQIYPVAALADLRQLLENTIEKAQKWLDLMTTSGGRFPLFGDSYPDTAPKREELRHYGQRLGTETPYERSASQYLKSSGYLRVEVDPKTLLFATLSGPKPDYQPGHSHADTFSFELFCGEIRLIADTGVSGYAPTPARLESRQTAAHNTLQLDAQDSSEVWSSFRVGRRASVGRINYKCEHGITECSACHDGYRFLRGRPLHRRQWKVEPNRRAVTIVDSVDTTASHEVMIRFHAGEGLQWQEAMDNTWELRRGAATQLRLLPVTSLTYRSLTGTVYPEMGNPLPVSVLEARGSIEQHSSFQHQLILLA